MKLYIVLTLKLFETLVQEGKTIYKTPAGKNRFFLIKLFNLGLALILFSYQESSQELSGGRILNSIYI